MKRLVVIALGLVFATSAVASPDDKSAPAPEDPAEPGTDAPTALRAVIAAERRAVQAERAELEQMRIDLAAAEAALDKKIEAVKTLIAENQAVLERTEKLRDEVLDEKIMRLVHLAEKMPPQEGAAYLSRLDEKTASTILQGMRVRQASKVMAALHPKKAASLSKVYLKRNEAVGRRPDGRKSRKR